MRAVAEHEAVLEELALHRLDRAPDAVVGAGRKPTSGSSNRLASSSGEPYDCVNEPRSASKPCSHTSAWISSRSARQRSTGPSSPWSSTERTARSNATQAITFEWTKWRRLPRISQMPSSGSRQTASSHSSSACWIAHAAGCGSSLCVRAW